MRNANNRENKIWIDFVIAEQGCSSSVLLQLMGGTMKLSQTTESMLVAACLD